jgi:hypothetical protein
MRGGAECVLGGSRCTQIAAAGAALVDVAQRKERMNINAPWWIWVLAGVALVLLILWLVGVRLDMSVR